ncbi:hypothetical protein AB0O76_42130 [Streptomyces sp. NPDC086554]|uniref:hypothetical protein n=1 Tax=Streptomyces sp. NPDC086554 TaxID=3154864 RepID=UPI00343F8655
MTAPMEEIVEGLGVVRCPYDGIATRASEAATFLRSRRGLAHSDGEGAARKP